jgi:uncharacterized protein YndB with AHSA1/START domain
MATAISPLHVRRSSLIQAPPERVWQEFETFEQLAAWFGRGHTLHRFEPKVGGQVELGVTIGDEERRFGGSVLVFERARELTLENNWYGEHAWPVPTFFTIRLTPLYGGTQVEILHHGFDRLGADAADALEGYEGGWDTRHLKALRDIVEAS